METSVVLSGNVVKSDAGRDGRPDHPSLAKRILREVKEEEDED